MATLSLRPWAREQSAPEEGKLGDVLARVAFERGHFRNITEAALQEELANEGALEASESEKEDEEEEVDTVVKKPSTRDELFQAKFELLGHVAQANNDVMLALDYVSMLQSRDAQQQASTTISVDLKKNIPLGTIGVDFWQRVPVEKAREAQDDLLATNARLAGLQQSADGILAAASRLRDNVRRETRYWDQVLSITDKGLNVCRAPGMRHTLAVTYGFSESASQFSRQGIAALVTNSDGDLLLEHTVGSKPKALRITLKTKEGDVIGQSRLPTSIDESDDPPDVRISRARDSLFEEELFHEMIRESRSMLASGVRIDGSSIVLKSPATQDGQAVEVLIDLITLDGEAAIISEHEQDRTAEAIALTAKMLLSFAHQEKLRKRSRVPPPMSEREDERSTLPILRPLLSFVLHRAAVSELNTYLQQLQRLSDAAKVGAQASPAKFSEDYLTHATSFQSLTGALTRTWASQGEWKDDEHGCNITFSIETTLATGLGPQLSFRQGGGPIQRTVRFDSLAALRASADATVAISLAEALGRVAEGDWTVVPREAVLTSKSRAAWITLDSEDGAMSLCTTAKKITWSLTGESSNSMFWSALQELFET